MSKQLSILFLVLFFTLPNLGDAQSRWAIERGGGPALYFGELHTFHLDPSLGLRVRFDLNEHLSLGYNIDFAYLHAKDAWSNDPMRLLYRNLSFRSVVLANSLSLHYFPFSKEWKVRPYLNIGFGVFYMRPEAKLGGVWYDLRNRGTEGQFLVGCPDCPEPASRYQVEVPLGLGFEFDLSEKIYLGCEIKQHFTFTDYLDDVGSIYADRASIRASDPIGFLLNRRGDPSMEYPQWEDEMRGNPKTRDSWMQMRVYFGVRLGH